MQTSMLQPITCHHRWKPLCFNQAPATEDCGHNLPSILINLRTTTKSIVECNKQVKRRKKERKTERKEQTKKERKEQTNERTNERTKWRNKGRIITRNPAPHSSLDALRVGYKQCVSTDFSLCPDCRQLRGLPRVELRCIPRVEWREVNPL